jgi:hypothetical protein
MTGLSLFRSAIALFVVGLLASCAGMETPSTASTAAPAPALPSYAWNGDGVPGPEKIVVNINEQRAYFYKGKALVGETTVSTGKPGFSTPPGEYRVVWKDKDHISTRFGDYVDDFGNVVKSNIDSAKDPRPKGSHYDGARMPFAMFFRGGYAMHQGYVPPYAASHGCIRLPNEIAEIFFNAAPLGTPVLVKQGPVVHVSPPLNPAADLAPAPRPRLPIPVIASSPAPAAVLAPGPRSRLPVSVRAPSPTPPAVLAPAPRARLPVPVRNPSPTPAAVLAPAPRSRLPVPVRTPSPTPAVVVAPAPRARVPVPVRTPSPTPAAVPAPAPRVRGPSPTPAATPTPASRARARANAKRSRPRQDQY